MKLLVLAASVALLATQFGPALANDTAPAIVQTNTNANASAVSGSHSSASGGAGGNATATGGAATATTGASTSAGGAVSNNNIVSGGVGAIYPVQPILGSCNSRPTVYAGVGYNDFNDGFLPSHNTNVNVGISSTIGAKCDDSIPHHQIYVADMNQCIEWRKNNVDISTMAMCKDTPAMVVVVSDAATPAPQIVYVPAPAPPQPLPTMRPPHFSDFTPRAAAVCAPMDLALKHEYLATPYNGWKMTRRSLYRLRAGHNARLMGFEMKQLRDACVPLDLIASSLDG
jgi:hypothetical protein